MIKKGERRAEGADNVYDKKREKNKGKEDTNNEVRRKEGGES